MMRSRFPLLVIAGGLACAKAETPTTEPTPATPNVVVIRATDFAFSAPDTIPAGMTSFHLVADTGFHHATILKIGEGKSFADMTAHMQTMKPTDMFPSWITDVGGPNPPAPGDTTVVTHDLQPGNYALICFVDVPDKVPHMAKGMVRPLVVAPSTAAAPAPAPASDVSMTLMDYGFEITPALTAGEHVVKVTNTAQQSHEFFIAKLDSGKTMADFGKWAADYKGPPPGKQLGGLAAMAPGGTAYVRLQLEPGNYLLLCFVPDKADGKPHLEHGMAKEITVQ